MTLTAGAAISQRPLAAVLIGAVVAPDDSVAVTPEAAHVHLHAAPGDEAVGLDAELAVDVDRPAPVRLQDFEEAVREGGVVARVTGAAGALARAAVEVGAVIVGEQSATVAAAAVGL